MSFLCYCILYSKRELFTTAPLFFPNVFSSFKDKKRLGKKIGKEKLFIPEFFHFSPDIFQFSPSLSIFNPNSPGGTYIRMIKICLNWITFLKTTSWNTGFQSFTVSLYFPCVFCGCVVLYVLVVNFKLHFSQMFLLDGETAEIHLEGMN